MSRLLAFPLIRQTAVSLNAMRRPKQFCPLNAQSQAEELGPQPQFHLSAQLPLIHDLRTERLFDILKSIKYLAAGYCSGFHNGTAHKLRRRREASIAPD